MLLRVQSLTFTLSFSSFPDPFPYSFNVPVVVLHSLFWTSLSFLPLFTPSLHFFEENGSSRYLSSTQCSRKLQEGRFENGRKSFPVSSTFYGTRVVQIFSLKINHQKVFLLDLKFLASFLVLSKIYPSRMNRLFSVVE
jgi:hypothetical protein